ncbi:hypothetical protein L3Q82_013812 [Scortum barcoo]|uniref:Uncharacterized protein n=1 Tax=Scortum barcoo TaxID=214431 RepID=A0ACB8VW53_9TELE|nr:hypothetical protein L3Q82_013812 [Scortum barcoo]
MREVRGCFFGVGVVVVGVSRALCPLSAVRRSWRSSLVGRHAVKVLPQAGCSVEEVGSAVGEVVGFESVKSASRMNSAVLW